MPKHYDQHEITRLRARAHHGPEAMAELVRRERNVRTRLITAMNAIRQLAVAGYSVAWSKNQTTGEIRLLLGITGVGNDAVATLVLKDAWLAANEIARIDRLLAGQDPETGMSLGVALRAIKDGDEVPYWDLPITRLA